MASHNDVNNQKVRVQATLISRASVSETTFRILITGPEDVVPLIARQVKKFIFETYRITKLKIHHAYTLNEEIAQKLSKFGLHAVVVCTDASKSLTTASVKETLKHLTFDLISSSLFLLNISRPKPEVFPTVVDAMEKLSIIYNVRIVHILLQDERSIAFGVGRVTTAALLSAKFIPGYEPPTFKNIDLTQSSESAL